MFPGGRNAQVPFDAVCDVKEKFAKIRLPVVADGPEAFTKRVQHEVPMYKDVIDKAGLKIQ